MYPVVLQPLRRSSILSRDLLLTPQNPQDPIPSEDLFHENRPEDPDPSCCLTASAIRRRAVAYGHIAIAKAIVTPFSGLGCILMGQLLRLSFTNSGEQYTSPPYMTALAGLVGGFCLTGSVILLNILLDITPRSGTRWHKYLTWPYLFIICAASAAAGPLGVLIVNFNWRSNSEILDLFHAVSASGLGAGIVLYCLLLLKYIIYVRSRRHKQKARETGKQSHSSSSCSGGNCTCYGCDCSGCDCGDCSCCDCNGCDCGGCGGGDCGCGGC